MQLHYLKGRVKLAILRIVMLGTPERTAESTLTERYQTTIPAPIRKALGLNKADKISYTIQPDGRVTISKVGDADSDPILGKFLNFLAEDIETNPQHIQALNSDLVDRVRSLVGEVELNLDVPLSDEDE